MIFLTRLDADICSQYEKIFLADIGLKLFLYSLSSSRFAAYVGQYLQTIWGILQPV